MELSDLVTFSTVARLGGITRAADELNTVQSNITQRVKALEAEIGVALFLQRHLNHRMPPQLQEDEIRFECAIGGEVRPPVTVSMLPAKQMIRGTARRLRASGQNSIGLNSVANLVSLTATITDAATVVNAVGLELNSETRVLKLFSQVRGTYDPNKAPKNDAKK